MRAGQGAHPSPLPPTPAVGVYKRGTREAMQEGFQEGWALSDVVTEGCAGLWVRCGLGWKGQRGWQVCWSYTPALPLDQQKHFVIRLLKTKKNKMCILLACFSVHIHHSLTLAWRCLWGKRE